MILNQLLLYIYIFSLFAIVALVAGVFIVDRIRKKKNLLNSLGYILYEVTFSEEGSKTTAQGFREVISVMEQFYSGMATISDKVSFGYKPYFVLELALSHIGEETIFYVSVPKNFGRLFEKQLESLYPHAHIELKKEDYNIFNSEGGSAGSILRLEETYALPIRTYRRLDADPLEVIANAFSKLKKEGEGAAMQIAIYPAERSFKRRVRHVIKELKEGRNITSVGKEGWFGIIIDEINDIFSGKKNNNKNTPSKFDEEGLKLVEEKISSPVFKVNLRLIASAATFEEASAIIRELESSFLQFSEPQGNKFKFIRMLGSALERLLYYYSFRLFDRASSIYLNASELTSVFHFPAGTLSAPKLKMLKAKSAPAPSNVSQTGILLGKNIYRGEETEIRIKDDDRRRHMYIIGQTGVGKTEFLKSMIYQDIADGKGVCVLDPHGDMVSDILGLIPANRVEDVIYFDPGNTERPMGLNFLEYDPAHPEQKTFIIDELMQIFNKLYNMQIAGGPMFEQYFRNAAHLVMEDPSSGCTLLEIARVFTEKEFRDLKLSRSRNPIVNAFWKEVAEKAGGEHSLQNMVPYITSKFDTFLSNEIMRPIIGQEKSAFRFREVMDEKKILLVNLAKGRLGELNSSLLGLIIVGKILMAAFSRFDVSGDMRNDYYLYLDEFQNITTPSITTILSEARKFRLNLILAHQFIGQLTEDVRKAVFGNTGTIASFRIGREDADFLEKHFEPVFSGHDLMNIENYHVYLKTLMDGKTVKPFNIETLPPRSGNPREAEAIKALSSLKYGVPKQIIEEEINNKYKK